ncbi:unnamed protein product [Brassica oleracea var. botrytis]
MKFLPPRQFLIRIFCNGVSVNTVLCCCSSSAHDRSHNYKRVRLVSASGGGLALSSVSTRTLLHRCLCCFVRNNV